MHTLKNKIVIITGAGSGFGRALALALAKLGAIPIATDVNTDGLGETAARLDELQANYASHVLDIRKRANWETVAEAVEKQFGGIDVLINKAGVMSRAQSFMEMSEEHCRFVFEVNFWGMYNGVQALVPYLEKRPHAHIVNVSSSLALIGTVMASVYCASKAAVSQYTAVLKEELRGTGIDVTLICPGVARTNLGRNVAADTPDESEFNAKNFERFARMPPEKVAAEIIKAILHNRRMVATGLDGKAFAFLQRFGPGLGHRVMALAYRKIGDPKVFAGLDAMKRKHGEQRADL